MSDLHQQMAEISQTASQLEKKLGEISGELAETVFLMSDFLARYKNNILAVHTELVKVQRTIADLRTLRGDPDAREAGEADTSLSRMVELKEWLPVQEQYERVWGGKEVLKPTGPKNDLRPASPRLKKLYAEIASHFHPELAVSEDVRYRYQQIMERADKAYVSRNELQMQSLVDVHHGRQNLPAVINEQVVTAARHRIAWLEWAIVKLEGQLFEMQHGDVAKVRTAAEHAWESQIDLLSELESALKRELDEAVHELADLEYTFRR